MSDTKRILVWLFMLIWCVLSVAFCRPGWAANTIIIKKKVASAAAGGSFTPVWVNNGNHPPAADSVSYSLTGYHCGGLITAPVGATKITAISGYYINSEATTYSMSICVWPSAGGAALGGGLVSLPNTAGAFTEAPLSSLNISVTGGTTYFIGYAVNNNNVGLYYWNSANGYYNEESYAESCPVSAAPSIDTNHLWALRVYFE